MFPRATFYFLLVLGVCIGGFWTSFFAHPSTSGWPYLLHGIVATGWVLLLILQAGLARQRRIGWHRRSGQAAWLLAPGLILSGAVVLWLMLAGPDHFPPGIRAKLAWFDLVSLPLFTWLFVMAMRTRHEVRAHARFMSATAVVLLPPALARLINFVLPGVFSFEAILQISLLIPEAILLALVANDIRLGQARLAFPATLGGFLFLHLGLALWAGTAFWQLWMAWPASLG
jgi:hypothetical protein